MKKEKKKQMRKIKINIHICFYVYKEICKLTFKKKKEKTVVSWWREE